MVAHKLIEGSQHQDQRGCLKYFNPFDMKDVRRFYEIIASSTEIIRAWQGHRLEKKWFYCLTGSFVINLIEVDDFESPSHDLIPVKYVISEKETQILEITGGIANGFRAVEDNSRLIIFSNYTLNESISDDFRFPVDYWEANWQIGSK